MFIRKEAKQIINELVENPHHWSFDENNAIHSHWNTKIWIREGSRFIDINDVRCLNIFERTAIWRAIRRSTLRNATLNKEAKAYPTYNIKTIDDFSKIPLDKLDHCLFELKEVLKAYGNDSVLTRFTWIDDGKIDMITKD